MARSFALGERFERFIDRQVKGGRFNNASEVVRAGLRLLEDTERRRIPVDADIRTLIEESDRTDTRVPLREAFARLEKRYALRSPKRKR